MAIITLTTDFGSSDGYVGAMKGVILTKAPSATIVDIAHDIPRGDIAHAAWVVHTSTREYPSETIHVVVVDPGVGGARRAVVAQANSHWLVGPDNGVFAYMMDRIKQVRVIAWSSFKAKRVSPTFHGRDVFAWTAGRLGKGADPAHVGPEVKLEGRLPWGPREPGLGRIVHVDRFGNLISDLPAAEAGGAVTLLGRTLTLVRTYEDVPSGELLAYIGSADTVEVAVRDGRADRALAAQRGTVVAPAARTTAPGPYR
jgi:S-adenosyl-L-methionine hydrolase (adenosine-forming)